MTGISSVGRCHVCGEGEEGLKRGQAELHRGLDKLTHEGYAGGPKEQEGKEHSEQKKNMYKCRVMKGVWFGNYNLFLGCRDLKQEMRLERQRETLRIT